MWAADFSDATVLKTEQAGTLTFVKCENCTALIILHSIKESVFIKYLSCYIYLKCKSLKLKMYLFK